MNTNPNVNVTFNQPTFARIAAGIMLTGLLASCSAQGDIALSKQDMVQAPSADGEIFDGARLRHDPQVMDDGSDGSTNICATTEKKVEVEASSIFTSTGLGYDMNGPWIGIKVSDLPKEYKNDCQGDADGIVWTITKKTSLDN